MIEEGTTPNKSVEEIQSLNYHLRVALNQVSEAIVILESGSNTPLGPRIVYANQAASDFSGYKVSGLIGQPIGLIFDRDRLPDLVKQLSVLTDPGEPYRVIRDLLTNNDKRKKCLWTILPVKDSLNETVNFTIRFSPANPKEKEQNTEVSSGEALQEDLARSRLESLQIVSSGLAHDFRNGLLATKLGIDVIRIEAGDNEEIAKVIDDVELSLDANSELATQMIEFTHGEESKLRIVNLHGLLRKTARMSTVGNNVTPELSIQRELWDVEIDSVQIRQVFQNIIINGCQAMPSGGPMQISARNVAVPQDNTFGLEPGNYVVVGIKDRGCGIDPNVIGKVFDPYFTTKPNGTGIGLASCKQIVERHRGKILVESTLNAGTEFIIFLPAEGQARSLKPDRSATTLETSSVSVTRPFLENLTSSSPSGGTARRRILVVDDDALIRKLASKILVHLNLDPVVAEDGEEALQLIRQSFREGPSFSAVILDLNLPRLGGAETMREIRKIDSSIRVIVSSGSPMTNGELANEWDGVLSKPYGKDAMETVLSKLMARDREQKKQHHQISTEGALSAAVGK